MICPQTYRTHSGSSSERKPLRFGAKSRATGWAVGGLPWWAALRTLTGDVMRRALWVGGIDRSEARSSCFASIKGEDTTPATLAKVFNCATTLHRSSERANTNPGERAARQKPRRKGGGYPDRRHKAAACGQERANVRAGRAETASGCGAWAREERSAPPQGARDGDAGRDTRSVAEKGEDAAANAMEWPDGGACPGGGRVRLVIGLASRRQGRADGGDSGTERSGGRAPRRYAAGRKALIIAMVRAVIGLLLGCYLGGQWRGRRKRGADFRKKDAPHEAPFIIYTKKRGSCVGWGLVLLIVIV